MGNLQCFSDFYCQELKLVIEIDGHIHDFKYVEDKNPKIWINFHSFFQ
ncbi:DUF559 domain-containing protein [Capnocytophaga sputigena]